MAWLRPLDREGFLEITERSHRNAVFNAGEMIMPCDSRVGSYMRHDVRRLHRQALAGIIRPPHRDL